MTAPTAEVSTIDLTKEQIFSIWENYGEKKSLTNEKMELAKNFTIQMLENCVPLHFHKCVEVNKKNKGVIENLWQDMGSPGILTQSTKNFCSDIAITSFAHRYNNAKTVFAINAKNPKP